MANIATAWGTTGTLTCTLASLASSASAGREWTALDLTSATVVDVLFWIKCKPTTGTIANDKGVHVFVGGYDGSASYTEDLTGADAAFTRKDPTNLRYLGFVYAPTANTSYRAGPFSALQAFGGSLPSKIGGFIQNYTGIAFTATAGDHEVRYQLVYSTVG